MKLSDEENIELLVSTRSNTSALHEPINAVAVENNRSNSDTHVEGLKKRRLIRMSATVEDGKRWKSTYGWERVQPGE